ncbi:hypothetical protein TCAL_10676 [Tigriopus californicus]|uniref:VIT domain-containing protein n=1 Tax=Tigriopus californicus TaxID=6832 RepID=A0A553PIH2_TIGCA|nr:von Willebrand factor A domain-containing protein 5A-like [Tigriopus californicus]TRY77470.1 hypothetical protein TCAL_10676 [Tigriopus californicus]
MPFLNQLGKLNHVECGLVYFLDQLHLSHQATVPVPLKSVALKVRLLDFVAQVTVEQEYLNVENRPIEALYLFPVEEEAAVIDFEAKVDGRTITTHVKEKDQARQDYQEAIANQQTAFLLEETKPDVFQIKVGHLKPGAQASVAIKYVVELPVEDLNSVRLSIPTTIAPRYVPLNDSSEAAQKLARIPYTFDAQAPLTIQVECASKKAIEFLKSPSHGIVCQAQARKNGLNFTQASLAATVAEMDRDFILLAGVADIHDPTVYLEESDGDDGAQAKAGMVSLVPSFALMDQKVELIFLVDRSGSMGGGWGSVEAGINQAKKALELFLHSLPADCYFNIWSFGSKFDALFAQSVLYDDDTLAQAKAHVATMEANYGGTEILQPINQILASPPAHPDHLRQIFVLTDGAVSNDIQVIAAVRANSTKARVFSLGLGASASRHLVKGIARSGNGTAVFATAQEDLRPKVQSQLKNALQPAITNVAVEWVGQDVAPSDSVTVPDPVVETKNTLLGFMKSKPSPGQTIPIHGQCPFNIPHVFDGNRLLVYRLFAEAEKPTKVVITAKTPSGPLTAQVKIGEGSRIEGEFVHQLAARKRIQDLEEDHSQRFEPTLKKEAIIRLAKKYRLASSHTSFVGIDSAESGRYLYGMVTREIKNQVPQGFGSSPGNAMMQRRGGPIMMSCMSEAMSISDPPMAMRKMKKSASRGRGGGGGGGFSAMSSDNLILDAQCGTFGSTKAMDVGAQEMDDCEEESDSTDSVDAITTTKTSSSIEGVIGLQNAKGMFSWGPAMETLTQKSQDEVMKAKPVEVASSQAWITIVAVALIQKQFANDKDLWELVVEKSLKILKKQCPEVDIQAAIQKANALL